MDKLNQKRTWDVIALFMIILVIMLPVYSANGLAMAVDITKNYGEDEIWSFLDAQGDVWTVEAIVSGAGEEAIDPASVVMKIGENEAAFSSCSDSPLGTSCEYISPLIDGVGEDEYAFQVVYNYVDEIGVPLSVSDSDVIKADGRGPAITLRNLEQDGGDVKINFKVDDRYSNAPSVGIKVIEISNADSGSVLQTINFPEQGVKHYDYVKDGDFEGILQSSFEGEGVLRVRVRAEDWLGHSAPFEPVASFTGDFIAPVVQSNINFSDTGQFIGQEPVLSDMVVDVVDTNLVSVKATSSDTSLDDTPANRCLLDPGEADLWHCVWEDVEIKPVSSVSIEFKAIDSQGNEGTNTFTKSFTVDADPPRIEFFGTERIFEELYYVSGGEQYIFARINEQGAGMEEEGVAANLLALGGGDFVRGTCNQTAGTYDCFWRTRKTFSSDGVARIGLSILEDKVGNEGEKPLLELQVDTSPPKIEKLEAYGVSEVGEKDYFQSTDILRLKLKVVESAGLAILIDLSDVIMDAEIELPETFLTQGLGPGWLAVTETEVCDRVEGKWVCQIDTPPIKSGYEAGVELDILVQDTAGNDAEVWPENVKNLEGSRGNFRFDLLGLSTEESPDYWEVSRGFPKMSGLDFIDLDVVPLTFTRAPLKVKFQSDNHKAKVLSLEVEECVAAEGATAPDLSRVLLLGSSYADGHPNPTLNMFMEFVPFDGRQVFGLAEGSDTFEEAIAEYECQFRIFSRFGDDALRAAELQTVKVEVPFSFTDLGSLDENLAKRIKDLKESDLAMFYDVFGTMNKWLQWITWAANLLDIVYSILELISIFQGALVVKAGAAEKSAVFGYLGPALRGACVGFEAPGKALWEWIEWLQVPLQILNCQPAVWQDGPGADPDAATFDVGWYGQWQRSVLDIYNVASGRDLLGVPANSLYENIYLSVLGLCLPGIIYNVNKAREIHCRKIVCYGREVPAGIATIEACNQLYDLQMCLYFMGPAWDFVGMGGLGAVGGMLKAAFASPLGWLSLLEVFACAANCGDPKGDPAITICKIATGLNKVLSIINSILSSINNRPSITAYPYCEAAESIDLDELAGVVDEEEDDDEIEEGTESAEEVEEEEAPPVTETE